MHSTTAIATPWRWVCKMISIRCLIFDAEASNVALQEALQPVLQQLPDEAEVRLLLNDKDSEVAAAYQQCAKPPLPKACVCLDNLEESQALALKTELEALFTGATATIFDTRLVLRPNWQIGQRTPGTVQLCTFKQKQDISREEFIAIWRDSHTQVAIDTQSTFGYFQNLALEGQNIGFDALVEEHFPIEAAASPEAFFDAVDDPAKLRQNIDCMMESCARFIQQDTINVIHLSEYKIK